MEICDKFKSLFTDYRSLPAALLFGGCRAFNILVLKHLRKSQIIFQIWVQSPHNASGYFTIYGDDSSYQDHFSARLVTGNTGEVYARTGYLGFLRRTEAIGSDGGMNYILE